MQRFGTVERVLADAAWPTAGWLKEIVLLAGGVGLLAVSAQLQVRLPFSLVPVTGQTLVVLLLGAALGSRRGPAVVASYLVLGLLGAPVFAAATAGPVRLAGPTGGYLAGFVVAAGVVGWLSEHGWDRRTGTAAAGMVIGNLCIYAIGALWLARFVGGASAVQAGIAPFILGDLLKIGLAATLLPAAWRVVGRPSGAMHGRTP